MIGLFDSGVGGLTVLKALKEVLPSADVVYFGDTKNAPYGNKNRSELSQLTIDAITLLRAHKADRIISACNSVSASLAISLYDAFDIATEKMIEMVGPTVSYFRNANASIGLCVTSVTIDSGMYQNAFKMCSKNILAFSIPELASAIEDGVSKAEIKDIIKSSLPTDISFATLILACTHYPLVADIFKEVLGPEVEIFDPAVAVAERAFKLFWPQEVHDGTIKFLISQESETFRKLAGELFTAQKYTIGVV